jgi:hypothetical protein
LESGLKVPLHRFGEIGQIAKAALFRASDDSSFMTDVDGAYRSFNFFSVREGWLIGCRSGRQTLADSIGS